MFTASHNPARYNGLKLCLSGARPIGRDTGLNEIQASAESLLDEWATDGLDAEQPSRTPSAPLEHRSVLDAYADPRPLLRRRRCAPPAAGGRRHRQRDGRPGGAQGVRRASLRRVDSSSPSSTGSFPNHPADPIQPENLVALKQAVLEAGADIGLAFDGDADRVFLVDEKAEPVSGSLTTALVASSMLDKHPGFHRPLQLHLLPGGPRSDRRAGWGRYPNQGGPQLHQAGDGGDRSHLRRRAFGPLLLPGQLPGRLGDHRRDGRARAAERDRKAALRTARALQALLAIPARSTRRSTTRPARSS